MRLVTWNCNKSFQRKISYLAALQPDLAVVQECADGAFLRAAAVSPQPLAWAGWPDRANPHRVHDGLAVFSWTGLTATRYEGYDAALAYALPLRMAGPFAFNVLAIWIKPRPRQPGISSHVHSLECIIDTYTPFLTERDTVVLGDFNTSAAYEEAERRNRLTHNGLVARLDALGLRSAYHSARKRTAHGGEPEMTHRNITGRLLHIDYCFLPQHWGVPHVTVEPLGTWPSDHAPLIVDITL